MTNILNLSRLVLSKIINYTKEHPKITSSIFPQTTISPDYIIKRLSYIAYLEKCDIKDIGKKLGISNFSSLTLIEKIKAVYDKYHIDAEYIQTRMSGCSWKHIDILPLDEFKSYIETYNRLKFWEKLPGGKEYLQSDEIKDLTDSEKAKKLLPWLLDHKEILDAKELNLASIGLTELPLEISLFTKLEKIDLSNNNFTTLPSNLPLNQIKSLTFADNPRLVLPDLINMDNLEYLFLMNNNLTTLPNINLPNLIHLSLSNNKIKKLPNNFYLPNLQMLYWGNNKLEEITRAFNLPNLNVLILDHNNITVINSDFNSPMLTFLNVSDNLLETIPDNTYLKRLTCLIVDNNPLKSMPESPGLILPQKHGSWPDTL